MLITDVYSNKELELLNLIENGAPLWLPNPDNLPQMMAYINAATVLGYGGSAGGGKTDLMIGMSLNQHQKSMIIREEGTQMTSIVDRLTEIIGTRDGYNGQANILRLPKRGQQIEFGSLPNPGDENKYQGRPHDFLGVDEATNVRLQQIRFLTTWLRSATPGQVVNMLLTFNPPVNAEGRWVLEYFKSWLSKQASALPGELRYYVTIAQKDIEVVNKPCVIIGDALEFDFNPLEYTPEEIITPQSRTFIPARVRDNTYLGGAYLAQLQALPEPLRSQMLNGDFTAGIEDDEWQVIPTAWVENAMARWTKPDRIPVMDSEGVDVARGGHDNSIIFRRHGMWWDEPLVYPGTQTPDGPTLAAYIIASIRDRAPVHIDIVGVGSSPYDFMKYARFQVAGINGGEKSNEKDKAGVMGFSNVKSCIWWRAREAFDPANNTGISIPRNDMLLKDLTSLTWKPEGPRIRVESRKDIIKRIGRSPDWGSAFVLSLMKTAKVDDNERSVGRGGNYDPFSIFNQE